MKRIITLMMALALVFGAVANSSAADIKAKGTFQFGYEWTDNQDFNDSDADNKSEDDFVAKQRFRTQIDITANENLKGVVFFEINHIWGRNDSATAGKNAGGQIGSDGVGVQTRRAYIDWTVPNTALSVRMGIQGLALPGVVAGSPILDNDVAAIVTTYKFNDMFSMNAFWARPYDTSAGNDSTGANAQDEMDIFGLIAGIKLDGIELTPYAVYASVGQGVDDADLQSLFAAHLPSAQNNLATNWGVANAISNYMFNGTLSEDNANVYWLGLSTKVTLLDPISFKLDAVYGSSQSELGFNLINGTAASSFDNSSKTDDDILDRAGWLVNAKLSYKMDMVTPGVIAWYASGEDDDITNGSERLPVIDGAFAPTSFGYDGGAAGFVSQDTFGTTNVGTWAAGLLLEDIKVIDNLTSQIRVVYVEGTNDADVLNSYVTYTGGSKTDLIGPSFLTDKDSAWEVNFDHKYDIYENLAMYVEMGYINLDLDESTWGLSGSTSKYNEDAYKLGFVFTYSF